MNPDIQEDFEKECREDDMRAIQAYELKQDVERQYLEKEYMQSRGI